MLVDFSCKDTLCESLYLTNKIDKENCLAEHLPRPKTENQASSSAQFTRKVPGLDSLTVLCVGHWRSCSRPTCQPLAVGARRHRRKGRRSGPPDRHSRQGSNSTPARETCDHTHDFWDATRPAGSFRFGGRIHGNRSRPQVLPPVSGRHESRAGPRGPRQALTHPPASVRRKAPEKKTHSRDRPPGRAQAGRQAKVASQRNGAPELGSVPPLQFPVPSVARSLPFPCFLPPPP